MFNPFTALMSPEKDQQKCEIWNAEAFFFFTLACEGIFIKMYSTENRFVVRLETILFLRRVNASFSPHILQVGAVKGLKHTC